MKKNRLGNSHIEVSEICLGTMTWGQQNNEADAHSQLDLALEMGVNFIDTAEMYPVPPKLETYSLTEQYIGSWLKKKRDRSSIIIATKVAGRTSSVPSGPPGLKWIRNGPRLNKEQIFKVLDSKKTNICFNSTWMNKMSASDLIALAGKYTVARMLERDDFHKRYSSSNPISIHEFLYPLIQGYDSVVLEADIELGGTDQKFNLLVGRELQKDYGQTPQVVMTLPILEGLDGVKKMSKSLGNYIGITDEPEEMFGKIMSISDDMMWRYFELLSSNEQGMVSKWQKDVKQGANPRDIKFELANEIIERFHNKGAATRAKEDFITKFQKNKIPDQVPEVTIRVDHQMPLPNVLKIAGLVQSSSEGMRMIKQGGVKIDGAKVTSTETVIEKGSTVVLQVGKRKFAKTSLI